MNKCFFVSDLHGIESRYKKLFKAILHEQPSVVFFGGDLLPHTLQNLLADSNFPKGKFVNDFFKNNLVSLKQKMGKLYPKIFLILGNDDIRIEEQNFINLQKENLCVYIHQKQVEYNGFQIFGYSYVPPTPFMLKDWEKFDVSRFVDPACISPLNGKRTVAVDESEIKYGTIQKDLDLLVKNQKLDKAVFLLHSPPYKTNLDRAALDGKSIDHVPLDVHCGSIAIKRFIKQRQPLLTLHGHIHESTRLTGAWQDKIFDTVCFSAAHDGKELSIVKFDLENLSSATREIL